MWLVSILAAMVLLIVHEVLLYNDASHASMNKSGLIYSIITIILTQPMFYVFSIHFLRSIRSTTRKFNKVTKKADRLVRKSETDNIVSGRYNEERISDLEDIHRIKKETELIGEKHENLTKAWSPLLFVAYITETIVIINAGFLVSKYLKHEISMTSYGKVEVALMSYFILYSSTLIFIISLEAKKVHESLNGCITTVK